ncbi:MAG: hypothetical protein R2741_06790 [Methanolobus sp.]
MRLNIINLKDKISLLHIRNKTIILLLVFISLSLVVFFSYNDYKSSSTIPELEITFINNEASEITIYTQGEFFLSSTGTPSTDNFLSGGKIELQASDDNYLNLVIPPNGELTVYVQIIYQTPYLELFKRGDIDMLLVLNSDEKDIYVRGIRFDEDTFSKGFSYYL